MEFVDTHAHLDDEQFDSCRDEVVKRAREAGVSRSVAVGCTLESSRRCVALAEEYEGVWAAVGIQPNYGAEAKPEDWDGVVALAEHPRVVAIGETGLDRYWDYTEFPLQEDFFVKHIRLARGLGLPFIVHMRDCGDDIVRVVRSEFQAGQVSGVMHSFTGDSALAQECLDLGLYISFAGMLTFKKSVELRETAKTIPLDRLLIETDSPYLSPHPHRGRRPNEPALVIHTAECLAECLGLSLEEIATTTTANAIRLFGFDSP